MPKHYKEMIDEIINKMDEQKESNLRYSVKFAYKKGGKIANAFYDNKTDAEKFMKSVISKGGKAILTTEDAPANSVASGGVDMNPTGARMMSPSIQRRKKKQGDEQDDITKKISKMVKANEDNNNVILKQVNESLSKVEDKSDEKLGLKQDVEVVEKEYKTFRDKYNA